MYFDSLTLAAVADELRTSVLDGRIQRARLPSPLSVALEIYAHGRRQHLLLSAHPQWTRAHLCVAKPSRGVERDTPLLLLLRKYVVGGRIIAIEQPVLERVLILSIAKGPHTRNIGLSDPHPSAPVPVATGGEERLPSPAAAGEGSGVRAWDDDDSDSEQDEELAEPLRCELIVEAMERRGNIVLVGDDNIILESARHITPRMSRRPVQPREPYELPPAQDKRDPRHATAEGIHALLDQAAATPTLARGLVAAYRGLSPLAAREVSFRATGRTDPPLAPDLPWEAIAAAVRDLWSAPWQPCLVFKAGEPAAFAPYTLTHLAPFEAEPATSAALELFYAARERLSSHEQRRDAVRQQLLEARERLDRQRRLLGVELERAQDLDRLRWEGEMIYGFLHALQPGQTALEVEGRTIALDPARTPAENAQERFHA
jgi:predicted ribosome quality control (RQC) complex YloA/Tae2 family protein